MPFRLRISVRTAMVVVFASAWACMVWNATGDPLPKSVAWVQLIPDPATILQARGNAYPKPEVGSILTQSLFDATCGELQLANETVPSDLFSGMDVTSPRGTMVLAFRKGTGDLPQDTKVVNAVVATWIKLRPVGSVKLIVVAKVGRIAGKDYVATAKRFSLSLLAAGVAIALVFVITKFFALVSAKRSNFRSWIPLTTGAQHDPQR
jgi:hypothetical protein